MRCCFWCPVVFKTSSQFIFFFTCLFYSCPLAVSWTWSSVFFLTRLLYIPLKDRTVLCCICYIARFTAKQCLRFARDLGHYVNLYCIALHGVCVRFTVKQAMNWWAGCLKQYHWRRRTVLLISAVVRLFCSSQNTFNAGIGYWQGFGFIRLCGVSVDCMPAFATWRNGHYTEVVVVVIFVTFIKQFAFSALTLWHCWLDGRKGIPHVKNGGWRRWALVSPDGVAPSRMVGVSASVNLPLHHKVQKFSSGTGSPRWSEKKGRKTVVVWCGG